jgi:lipopolysaccharide biosynthesis glycosyltransferase
MIEIACCFDANFQTAFAVLAHSIERHTASQVVIHAIHDGPVPYAAFVARHLRKTKIVFHDGSAVARRFQDAGRQSRVTFVRLFLHEYLVGITKVLYLDADIVVRRDLAALFDTPLDRAPIAAAADHPLQLLAERGDFIYGPGAPWRTDNYIHDHLGLKNIASYFNAGVLLIDLARYATSGAPERAQAFLAQKGDASIFNDQDALNVALEGDVEFLDPRWNFNPDFAALAGDRPLGAELEAALRLCRDDPWIVHFAGLKPWEIKEAPDRWDLAFWQNLFSLVTSNTEAMSAPQSGPFDTAHGPRTQAGGAAPSR